MYGGGGGGGAQAQVEKNQKVTLKTKSQKFFLASFY